MIEHSPTPSPAAAPTTAQMTTATNSSTTQQNPVVGAAAFAAATRVVALIHHPAAPETAAPETAAPEPAALESKDFPLAADHPGFSLVDPAAAWLSVFDLGATRGDGIFETIAVRFGATSTLDAHLERFAHSARALDLPAPNLPVWAAAIRAVATEIDQFAEGSVKAVLTRGIEGSVHPTGWVSGSPAPDFSALRRDGIRVVTLDRGYRHDVAATAPWLLLGAKTLSYAINAAAVREAKRRHAADVIFVSSDGFVLDGATSSVLLRRGNQLISPGGSTSILTGTTQTRMFNLAQQFSLATVGKPVTLSELRSADAAWLVSSVRGVIPITAIDDDELQIDVELTAAMNAQH